MAYLKLFREIWRYAGGDRWKVVVFVLFDVIAHTSTILQPLVFAQILNVLQLHPVDIVRQILWWIAAWIGIFTWYNVFHRIGQYLEYDVAYRVRQRFIEERLHSTTSLNLKWHADHHSGDTISRIDTAAEALRNFCSLQFDYIGYFMMFWGPLIGIAFLSSTIAVAALFVGFISLLVVNVFDRKLARLYSYMNELQRYVAAGLYDYIGNIKTVITLRLGSQAATEINHRLETGYKPYIHAEAIVNAAKWLTLTGFALLLEAGVILFYILRRLNRNQPVLAGNVTAVYQYLQQITGTLFSVGEKYQILVGWYVAYEAAAIIPPVVRKDAVGESLIKSWQRLDISNLLFQHADQLTLDNLTLSLTAGEKIAFVGESGSGKSSLMGVLRGLYEPQSVGLTIDGKSFDTLTPLAGITTLIPQEPEIFENTIRYNITFGVEHSEAEVLEAVRIARFDAVLERLPQGLETDVRERGVTLSGGERQRLALARGILAASDSSIILLDEPTSSVDAYNEALIYENLFARYPDRTIVASIHRLHMLGRFDRVVVMERGRIVQSGGFEDLKAQAGVFKTLWEKAVE